MDRSSLLGIIKNWGYYLLPKPHPDSPGYTGLLVAIREHPTGRHYDPEKLHLRLRDAEGDHQWRTSSWLHPLKDTSRTCPGLVTLHDRNDKRVYFFTFGGSLEVLSGPGEIVHVLRSPAPILEVTGREETFADHLASETQVLLSEIGEKLKERAETDAKRQQVWLDPFQLCLAALQSVFQRYERVQVLQRTYHGFYDALQREKAWLTTQGLWPSEPLSPDALLPRCLI